MQNTTAAEQSKLLNSIKQNDLDQIRVLLADKRNVNANLRFTHIGNQRILCSFTPLAASLVYGEEETLKVILDAGGDLYKTCEYRLSGSSSRPDDLQTVVRLEPALLLTRFLSHFRVVERWNLLLTMCEAGLDPIKPSEIVTVEPEEEGGTTCFRIPTTVLDEIYLTIPVDLFDKILNFCDISGSFAKKDSVERFFDMIFCPRMCLDKFEAMVRNGFHDLSENPSDVDMFIFQIQDRCACGLYTEENVYCDLFKRFQILLLVCGFKVNCIQTYHLLTLDLSGGDNAFVTRFMIKLQDVIQKWNTTPKLLSILCRSAIRENVRRPRFIENVRSLELPKFLEDFVILPSDELWTKMGMRPLDVEFRNGKLAGSR